MSGNENSRFHKLRTRINNRVETSNNRVGNSIQKTETWSTLSSYAHQRYMKTYCSWPVSLPGRTSPLMALTEAVGVLTLRLSRFLLSFSQLWHGCRQQSGWVRASPGGNVHPKRELCRHSALGPQDWQSHLALGRPRRDLLYLQQQVTNHQFPTKMKEGILVWNFTLHCLIHYLPWRSPCVKTKYWRRPLWLTQEASSSCAHRWLFGLPRLVPRSWSTVWNIQGLAWIL